MGEPCNCSRCSTVTAMTACRMGQEHVIRIERMPKDDIKTTRAQHIADGPFKGIIINKAAETGLPEVCTANVLMEFTACLYGKTSRDQERREKRQLKFWFRRPADRSTQAACARDYFMALLQPEDFPKDYVNFIKKAILLSQKYPLIRRVDIVLRPATPITSPSHLSDSDEEDPYPPTRRKLTCFPNLYPSPRTPSTITESSANSLSQDSELPPSPLDDDDESNGPIENYITVCTPAVYDYQYLPEVSVTKKTFLSFRVRAKADAHIALSSVYGDTDERTHEIVIGGHNNTTSFIRDGGQGRVLAEAVTMRILNDQEFRDFWISWDEAILQVGKGRRKGDDVFLRWDIPPRKLYPIHTVSVSTASSSTGEWEFVESIDEPSIEEERKKKARREKIRSCLLWASKKQKMLSVLEDAYPNSLDTTTLLKMSNIKLKDMMPALVFLKEMHKRGLITEIRRGLWMRAPRSKKDPNHEVRIVLDLPRLPAKECPTVAIICTMFCEKLAIDAMIDNKISFVKYKVDGESSVYTLGEIGERRVVAIKLSRSGIGRGAAIAAGNAVTRIFGIFPHIEHLLLVGVGGAVPHYSDHRKHVRLGDVVVSTSRKDMGGPLYEYCEKIIHDKVHDRFKFRTRSWSAKTASLTNLITELRQLHEADGPSLRPWEQIAENACEVALDEEEASFRRPSARSDKLHAIVNGELVEVEHPKPRRRARSILENRTNIRYGPVGAGKYIPTNERLRMEFALQTGVVAYDSGFEPILDSLQGSKGESFLLIRGIADYTDGTTNKVWQPHASLCAAAYMKTLVSSLPKATPNVYAKK